MNEPINLSGIDVLHRGDAIFVPLPRALWRNSSFGEMSCSCGKCFNTGYWDTLAIAKDGKTRNGQREHTWMVHFPELQPKSVLDELKRESEARQKVKKRLTQLIAGIRKAKS